MKHGKVFNSSNVLWKIIKSSIPETPTCLICIQLLRRGADWGCPGRGWVRQFTEKRIKLKLAYNTIHFTGKCCWQSKNIRINKSCNAPPFPMPPPVPQPTWSPNMLLVLRSTISTLIFWHVFYTFIRTGILTLPGKCLSYYGIDFTE